MGSWESNKEDVKVRIREGNWKVAFGREITYDDVAEAVATAGESIDQLVTESVNQMEESIRDTITPEVKREAAQYAQRVIRNLIQGKNVGEQVHDIGRFNFKAGIAEFIGKNFVWIPNLSREGGYWQFVPPNVISYCPYVGFRFNTEDIGENIPIYAIKFNDARSSVDVFGRDSSANFKVSLYAVTANGRLAAIWDTDRWHLDFPAELAGHSDLRFTGGPTVFGRDSSANFKVSLHAITTDGRLAAIWDTDRWHLDFPAELAGHSDLRFTGSPAVFGKDPGGNKVLIHSVTTDGRLVQIYDTDRWYLDFPAELAGHSDLRFTDSLAVVGRDCTGNKVLLHAVTTDGRLVQIYDTDKWHLGFPAEHAGHSDLRFKGSPAVFGRDCTGNKVALYAVTTDGRLAQIWDTDRWHLDFPAEFSGNSGLRFRD